jgi:hypothetical protein
MSSPNQSAAIARLSAFVASYADMRGLDPEYVYSIHAAPGGRSDHIRISDLRTLLAMAIATPTPLPAAPDWRALCKELRDAYQRSEYHPGDYFPFTDSLINRADAALATPPAPPLEPRGCPTPGACSCPAGAIVPPELIRALELAEAALADIGDADREPGDDIAWAEHRAAEDLPRVRHALLTWREHATPPAATREAGPLPQAGAEISDEELIALGDKIMGYVADPVDSQEMVEYGRAVWNRAVLARWGGAAVPVPVSERLPETSDTIHPTGECWWFEPAADGAWYFDTYQGNYTHWLPSWALPVPAADKGEVQP